MDKISGIYCIENTITNKKYIGKSVDILHRWKIHKYYLNKNSHENTYLQHAWNKYGSECFKFYILETCDECYLNDKEIMYIQKYDSTNRDCGYNRTIGGTGGNTICSYTEDQLNEYKKKRSIILKEKSKKGEDSHSAKLTNQQVKEIIQMLLDGKYDDEISQQYDVNSSAIKSIRNHKTWKEFTEGIIFPKIIRRSYCRDDKITQYDMNGNIICQYKSLIDLKHKLGLNTSLISQVCRGIRRTAYGYIFRFNNDPYDKYDIKKISKKATPVDQYDLHGNLIATYPSVAEAQRAVGSRIDGAIYTDKIYTAGGFYWAKHGEIPLFLAKKENINV